MSRSVPVCILFRLTAPFWMEIYDRQPKLKKAVGIMQRPGRAARFPIQTEKQIGGFMINRKTEGLIAAPFTTLRAEGAINLDAVEHDAR